MGAPGTTKTIDRERERQASMQRGRPQVQGLWTEERLDLLRAGWAAGLSCSQIAANINAKAPGGGFSRSAVIGKAYRLLLPGRAAPSKPATKSASRVPRPPKEDRANIRQGGTAFGVIRAPSKPPQPLPLRDDAPPLATMETVTNHVCKWPIGDPQTPGFGFCGRAKPAGAELDEPYCAHHASIAFRAGTGPRTEAQREGDAKRRATFIRKAASRDRTAWQ